MEVLDVVPADTIALRLYSLPAAAASLYAWLVAALAAAVGLWRLRTAGASKPDSGVRSGGSLLVDDEHAQAPLPSPATIGEPRPAARAERVEPASPSEPSTPSKVRFTAYYGGSGDDDGVVDGVKKCADAADDDDGEVQTVLRRTASAGRRSTAAAAAPWEEEREMAVRRRGDLGWYRHLDMAALDGSVVRLWDGELTASPRGRRTRAGLELQMSL
ncbi:hypothetical protein ACP70R_006892 [Stipagrostis hirtigluma subsp. patula]